MTFDDATTASRLAASLPTARWFADKGAGIAGLTLHERLPLPPHAAAELVLANVHLAGGAPSARYVAAIDATGDDVAASPAVAEWLLELVLSGRSQTGRHGTFVGRPVGRTERAAFVVSGRPLSVNAVGGDASNTSLVVRSGSAAWIIKLFRRCREGIQPEVEVGEFLASQSPWEDTPRLRGWLEYVPVDDDRNAESTAIATVHEFAPGHTTAWDGLVRLLTAGDGLSGAYGSDVFAVVASLGRVTARMHRAFSARPDLPAFAPDIATSSGLQAAAARMREHAERVFALIESRLPQCEPAVALRLAAVLRARSKLVTHFECLPGIARATSTIRVHGDYHLGQVLVAEHDSKLLVIDFEGEPRRTLAERREKTWAAKDVAGMCRSFDYLLRHVAKSTGRAYAAADLEQLETRFLDTYRDEAAGAWWPTDPAAADMLLTVFKLDKAIYELAYELNNRPDWIDVPLAAIEEAVATAARSRG